MLHVNGFILFWSELIRQLKCLGRCTQLQIKHFCSLSLETTCIIISESQLTSHRSKNISYSVSRSHTHSFPQYMIKYFFLVSHCRTHFTWVLCVTTNVVVNFDYPVVSCSFGIPCKEIKTFLSTTFPLYNFLLLISQTCFGWWLNNHSCLFLYTQLKSLVPCDLFNYNGIEIGIYIIIINY